MRDLRGVDCSAWAAAVCLVLISVVSGGGWASGQTASQASAPRNSTQVATQAAPAAQPKQPTVAEKIAASKALLDINTATGAQLKALPGMGDEYVRRVIAGRPYTAKNQLATRGVLPRAEYEQIRELIVAHRLKP